MPASRRQALTLLGAAALGWPVAAGGQPAPVTDEAPITVDTGVDLFEHMTAPVTIDGQGPFHFLVDTGANTSCVSQNLAAALGLEASPPTRVHTVVGVRDRPSVVLQSLQVGGRIRHRVRAPVLPIKDSGVDGILGVDWLKGQRLTLGFKSQTLEIGRSQASSRDDAGVVVPARRRSGQLTIVDADLGSQRINAMIDSGSQVSMCNSRLRRMVLDAAGPSARDPAFPVTLETLAGERFDGVMFYLPFLRLGGLQLVNVPVVHADTHIFEAWGLKDTPSVVLGMDLLTQFRTVMMDFGRSEVRFEVVDVRSAASPPAPPPPFVRPS